MDTPDKRGSELYFAENTLASFKNVSQLHKELNCIEFDVQITRDKVPVIYHDWLISEIHFSSIQIDHVMLSDLEMIQTKRSLIYNSVYDEKWKFVTKEKIPTLAQALEVP